MFALLLAFVPPLVVVAARGVLALAVAAARGRAPRRRVWCFAFLAVLQLVRLLDPEHARALLLPLIPARARRDRVHPVARRFARSSRSRSRCPSSRSSLRGTVPLAVDDAEARRRQRRDAHAGRARRARRVPGELADARRTGRSTRAVSGLRAARARRRPGIRARRRSTSHTTQAVPPILTGQRPTGSSCRRSPTTPTTSSPCSASGTRSGRPSR